MSGWDDEDDLDELLFDDDDDILESNNVENVTAVSTNNNEQNETITRNEINQIDNDGNEVNIESDIQGQDVTAVENEEDDWEFEDEDIFNETNDDLDFLNDDPTPAMAPEEEAVAAAPPPPLLAAVEGTNLNHSSIPPPPPPPPSTQMENNSNTKNDYAPVSEMKTNPFLNDSDEEEEPTMQQKNEITTFPNDDNEKLDNAIVSDQEENDDGWSDDSDLFGEDEFLDPSSSSVPNAPPPPPPPPSVPAPLQLSPVANRTRSKTSTPCPPKPPHQQQQQPQPQPELTPSQQQIHQMLSTYTTNLTNSDYPSHLHYKLHSYQTKSNHTSSNTTTTTTPAAELRNYYAIRPKLRKYTLGVELTRMDYTLILENGSRTSDKDVIRSYFGVDPDGGVVGRNEEEEEEEEEATVEELLIRSANQSLLADALAALTGSEEDVLVDGRENDDFFGESDGEEEMKVMGLILSGPTLCMSSVAESCEFTVDLQCGKVEVMSDLAISVPFHGNIDTICELLDGHEQLRTDIIGDGRIILARVRVSVRFRPGGEGGNDNDEPTVQYSIQSVNPLLSSNSPVLREVAIALARDQEDPFFHEEEPPTNVEGTTDIRDLFLLNQHLLSDAGLLAVSDHLERLRGAAEAKSTGFRSALRQLDGVTNVSGKFQFLKGTANAARGEGNNSGFLGLGLTLPTAEAIEAAEREAQNAVTQDDSNFRFPRRNEVNEELRFPRPDNGSNAFTGTDNNNNARPPPPPPPPPPRPPQLLPEQLSQEDEDFARPKPIIGGLFTGLSRLAAAATQPSDIQAGNEWGEGGGTGLTPPSSPKTEKFVQSLPNDFPALYRKELDAKSVSQFTPESENSRPFSTGFKNVGDEVIEIQSKVDANVVNSIPEEKVEGEEDGGWSDDDFDFDEPELRNKYSTAIEDGDISDAMGEASSSQLPTNAISNCAEIKKDSSHLQEDQNSEQPIGAKTVIEQSICEPNLSFSKELSMALSEKVERENKEMVKSGRLKRWTPLRQDPFLRKHLMEVMRENLAQN